MITDYLLSNGTITIESLRPDGGHRTFRIRTQPEDSNFAPGRRVVALLSGPDNESDYTGFAFVAEDGGGVDVWRSKRGMDEKRSTWEWYADMLTRPGIYQTQGYRYLVSQRCRRCNRKLTDPISISEGIGPECAGRS